MKLIVFSFGFSLLLSSGSVDYVHNAFTMEQLDMALTWIFCLCLAMA